MPRTIITEVPEPRIRSRLAPRPKVLELKCPSCGKVFFRTVDLAQTVITCPACQTRLTFNKEGKCALIKPVEYKHKKKKIALAGVAAAATARAIHRRRQLKPISKVAEEVQKAVGVKRLHKIKPLSALERTLGIGGHAWPKSITVLPPREARRILRSDLRAKVGHRLPARRVLAHEIAHVTPAPELMLDRMSTREAAKTAKRLMGRNVRRPKRLRRVLKSMAGRAKQEAHSPTFKSSWRHVEKVMKRMGAMKKLRKLGYALSKRKIQRARKLAAADQSAALQKQVLAQRTHLEDQLIPTLRKHPAITGLSKTRRAWLERWWKHGDKIRRASFIRTMKKLKFEHQMYTLEDPKYVKTRFNEMKQHNVPFRTRMQVLSREYGGRGGYTSEELHKIVTGKTTAPYYIFPFVKGAPPEVNRILERTYRKHRAAGDTKTAAAIAAWTKVKQAGYTRVVKPSPAWVKKRSHNMNQLKPIQVVNYTAGARRLGKPRTEEERRRRHKQLHPGEKLPPRGTGLDYGAGVAAGRLAERGVRGLFGVARRHPRVVRGTGLFGAGYLTAKELEKRRKRKKGYQLNAKHFTPDIPLSRGERLRAHLAKKKPTRKGFVGVGKRIGGTTISAVKLAIIGLAAKELLDRLGKQQSRTPWLPEIRSDIELGGYEVLDQVVEYASVMPSKMVQTLKSKTGAALHKTKKGVERGLLVWLLGFLASELLGRGISKPQRRHEVVFPDQHQLYKVRKKRKVVPWLRKEIRKRPLTVAILTALASGTLAHEGYSRFHVGETGEQLPRRGFQPFTPTKPVQEPLPKWPGRPIRKRKLGRKIGSIAALPIAALLAIRLSKRRQEDYSFASAAKRTLRGVKKVGGGLGKGMGVATNIAIPAMIISELWPRKKRRVGPRPVHPPVQSLTQPYGLAKGLKRLLKLKKVKAPPKLGRSLRDLTLSQKDPALADLNKRLAAAAQKRKKFSLSQYYFDATPLKVVTRRVTSSGGPRVRPRWKRGVRAAGRSMLAHPIRTLVLGSIAHNIISNLPKRLFKIKTERERQRFRTQAEKERQRLKAQAAMTRLRMQERRRTQRLREKLSKHQLVETYPFVSTAQRRWMHATHPKMAAKWEGHTPKGKKLPEKVSKHLLGVPIVSAAVIAALLANKKKKEQVEKHSLSVPWALKRARDLMRLKGARPQGREVVAWARDLAKKLRSAQLKTIDAKKKVELGARAGAWETVADQVGDVIGRAQLEKVGLLAAATTAAGVTAHEVGKKRERARIRKLVG